MPSCKQDVVDVEKTEQSRRCHPMKVPRFWKQAEKSASCVDRPCNSIITPCVDRIYKEKVLCRGGVNTRKSNQDAQSTVINQSKAQSGKFLSLDAE